MTLDPYFHAKDDTYCYPDSNVLRNLLGINDYDELVSAEGRLTVIAMIQLDADPVKGRFDTDHLKSIHRRIFKDIYDWAGEFRTVEISKRTFRTLDFLSTDLSVPRRVSRRVRREVSREGQGIP